MPIMMLYNFLFKQVSQVLPQERITRIRNLTWLMIGMLQSKSVHLSHIANKIPSQAKLLSVTRRLTRFLANPSVRPRRWYRPIATWLVECVLNSSRTIRLIADGTKVGFHHQLLIISIAFRRRALPLAWTWVRSPKGHSSSLKQLALLRYVRNLIPEGIPVLVVGDSEFGSVEVIRELDSWNWGYVLRQKGDHLVEVGGAWRHFADLVTCQGQSIWLGGCALTKAHAYTTNLLAHWEKGEKDPWLLATNLPSRWATLMAYRLRMWIEEMFGDWKGHGFDIESTHLLHFARLSRLTLAVGWLYVWLVMTGVKVVKRGLRHIVDRKDRRDLSIFQIGLRWLNRALTNSLFAHLVPLSPKLSGG